MSKVELGERVWHRSYDAGVPSEIEVPELTLPAVLRRTAERHGRRAATIFMDRSATYGELARRAGMIARLLVDLGVRPGDRVALLFPNVPDEVAAYYGALQAGAVVVQINPLGTPVDMAGALKDSGSSVLIALDALLGRFMNGLAGAPLKHVLISSLAGQLPPLVRAGFFLKAALGRVPLPPKGSGESLDARLAGLEPLANSVPRSPDDAALLQYTGGTTGLPKAAELTHRNLVANIEQIRVWLPGERDREEVCLLAIPCFHVYGMTVGMNQSVFKAQTMVLHPRFEVEPILGSIERHRPTQFPGVQMFYQAISSHPKAGRYDLSSIEACLSGAGPLMRETQEAFEALTGAKVVEGYGLTEASPVTHCNPLKGRRKTGTIGVPMPSTDARVVDLDAGTRVLEPGREGELCVRGPQVMRGYWNRPDETREVLRDGWLHTGDIAVQDEEGFFRIVDRKKEMIKSGGENVYPRDVEEVLFAHPAVEDAGVAGVPDSTYGEMVKAYVVLKPGARTGGDELIAHCRSRLSGFQTPKAVAFRRSLPRTQVGKLLRRKLEDGEEA